MTERLPSRTDPTHLPQPGETIVVTEATQRRTRKEKNKDRARTGSTEANRRAAERAAIASTAALDPLYARDYVAERNFSLLDNEANTDLSEQERDVLISLIDARSALAEASVEARRGTLSFNQEKRATAFTTAEEEYTIAREAMLDQERSLLDNATDAEREAVLEVLSERELGALAGEEANYYLHKENSLLQRSIDRYTGMSRGKRLAVGLGASALVGVTAGLTLGFAAAGAVIGTRVGKGYINREANRLGTTELTDEEKSRAIDASIQNKYQSQLADLSENDRQAFIEEKRASQNTFSEKRQIKRALKERRLLDKQMAATLVSRKGRNVTSYRDALASAEDEKNAKRTSLKWAIGGAAVGGILGAILENTPMDTDWRWHGVLRDDRYDLSLPSLSLPGIDSPFDNMNFDNPFDNLFGDYDAPDINVGDTDTDTDTGKQSGTTDSTLEKERAAALDAELAEAKAEAERLRAELEAIQEQMLLNEEAPANETGPDTGGVETDADTDAETEHNSHLYGEFSGETVSLDIPEGGSVWHELEHQVDAHSPNVSAEEKQRLVGNMLEALQEQHPDRDLSLVYPGEHFAVTLP